jgi:hypothetical protein
MSTSKVSVLSLLDAYSNIHEQGQNSQKACTWQITVARRNKGRHGALTNGVLLADDVREELRASKVLKSACSEPALMDEPLSPTKTAKESFSMERQFVLADPTSKKNPPVLDGFGDGKDKEASGLRRRKGAGENDSNEKKWSVEVEEDEEKLEEERLRTANPLDLFGAMPPAELKKAQAEAYKALESYVEAANLVAAIQQELQKGSK